MRIINKTGPLKNPADRDHCLQYMVAVALLHGTLAAEHYEQAAAADPRNDWLRERMEVVEQPRYSREYLDPEKRSIANAIQVFFDDGSFTDRLEIEYPLGHRRRRDEARPALFEKFVYNAAMRLPDETVGRFVELFRNAGRLDAMPVPEFIDQTVISIS